MSSLRHQLLKTYPADMDQVSVVTPLKVDIRLLCKTIVYNDLETVRGAKRGHCTRFAIDEKRKGAGR